MASVFAQTLGSDAIYRVPTKGRGDIMDKWLIIDRIEGDFAVCEDQRGQRRELPLNALPQDIREGDFLRHIETGTPTGYEIDREETQKRREANKALFDKLKKRGKQQ